MILHNDDDVQRGVEACGKPHGLWPRETVESVLDAVLPAYTTRVLRRVARDISTKPIGGEERGDAARWIEDLADAISPQQETDR